MCLYLYLLYFHCCVYDILPSKHSMVKPAFLPFHWFLVSYHSEDIIQNRQGATVVCYDSYVFDMMRYWLFYKILNVSKFFAFHIFWVPDIHNYMSLGLGRHLEQHVETVWNLFSKCFQLISFLPFSLFSV